jgi:hypothetical protein
VEAHEGEAWGQCYDSFFEIILTTNVIIFQHK